MLLYIQDNYEILENKDDAIKIIDTYVSRDLADFLTEEFESFELQYQDKVTMLKHSDNYEEEYCTATNTLNSIDNLCEEIIEKIENGKKLTNKDFLTILTEIRKQI